MAEPAIAPSGRFTYRDYRNWPDEERWELIGGIAFGMSPAPRLNHQNAVLELGSRIQEFLRGKPCTAFISPVDVLLMEPGQEDDEAENVVQPDIVVVCDPGKLANGRYIRGSPDLVVEILSPSTMKKDVREKFTLYERMGVKEYWIVEPSACWLHRYVLGPVARSGDQDDGKVLCYGEALVRDKGDGLGPVASLVLDGFSFVPDEVFGG